MLDEFKEQKDLKDFIIQTVIDSLEENTFGICDLLDERYYKYVALKNKNERYLKI